MLSELKFLIVFVLHKEFFCLKDIIIEAYVVDLKDSIISLWVMQDDSTCQRMTYHHEIMKYNSFSDNLEIHSRLEDM